MHDVRSRVGPDTRLECKICWFVYDPAEGDDDAQVDPGTSFLELPESWRCPRCDGPQSNFLPIED